MFLDGQQQLLRRLCKEMKKKERGPDDRKVGADPIAWAEAQRLLNMLNRHIGLPKINPEGSAQKPTSRITRVKRQRAIDQCDHSLDIFAEFSERIGSESDGDRIVKRCF